MNRLFFNFRNSEKQYYVTIHLHSTLKMRAQKFTKTSFSRSRINSLTDFRIKYTGCVLKLPKILIWKSKLQKIQTSLRKATQVKLEHRRPKLSM